MARYRLKNALQEWRRDGIRFTAHVSALSLFGARSAEHRARLHVDCGGRVGKTSLRRFSYRFRPSLLDIRPRAYARIEVREGRGRYVFAAGSTVTVSLVDLADVSIEVEARDERGRRLGAARDGSWQGRALWRLSIPTEAAPRARLAVLHRGTVLSTLSFEVAPHPAGAPKVSAKELAHWMQVASRSIRANDLAQANGALSRALPLAEELDWVSEVVRIRGQSGLVALRRGQYARAEAHLKEAKGLAEKWGDEVGLEAILYFQAMHAVGTQSRDAPRIARARLSAALASAKRRADPVATRTWSRHLATVEAEHFSVARARRLLRSARPDAPDARWNVSQLYVDFMALQSGMLTAAEIHAVDETATETLRSSDLPVEQRSFVSSLGAHTAAALGDFDRAERLLERVRALERRGRVRGSVPAILTEAMLLLRADRPDDTVEGRLLAFIDRNPERANEDDLRAWLALAALRARRNDPKGAVRALEAFEDMMVGLFRRSGDTPVLSGFVRRLRKSLTLHQRLRLDARDPVGALWVGQRTKVLGLVGAAADQARYLREGRDRLKTLPHALSPSEAALAIESFEGGRVVYWLRGGGEIEARRGSARAGLRPSDLEGVRRIYVVGGEHGVEVQDVALGSEAPLGTEIELVHVPHLLVLLDEVRGPTSGTHAVVIGDPEGTLLWVDEEARTVGAALQTRVVTRDAATVSAVRAVLEHPLGIFHFAGHVRIVPGEPLSQRLLLKDGSLTVDDWLDAAEIPWFVLLNACASGQKEDAYAVGLASVLLARGGTYALVTRADINDVQASKFVRFFYEEGGARRPAAALRRASVRAHKLGWKAWRDVQLWAAGRVGEVGRAEEAFPSHDGRGG